MSQGQSSRQAKASKEGNAQDASLNSGTGVSLLSKILHPSRHGEWHKVRCCTPATEDNCFAV